MIVCKILTISILFFQPRNTIHGFSEVWEHKGIISGAIRVVHIGNQRNKTFTRSPAWALTLSVQHDWAMREPQEVERTTDVSTLSFMLCTLGQVFGKVPSRYGYI